MKYEHKDFIGIYKETVSNSLCDNAMKFLDLCEERGLTLSRKQRDNTTTHKKEDISFVVPNDYSFTSEIDIFPNHLVDEMRKALDESLNLYLEEYSILSESSLANWSYKLQKTRPGEGYHIWHYEVAPGTAESRRLVWTLYLNDDFEAGETEFLYQNLRIKPEKGTICIFPAQFTHTHRGNPPIGNTKYIATGWFNQLTSI